MKTILETERLLLREYEEADAEAFLALNSNPDVMRFTGDAPLVSLEQARSVLLEHPIADYRVHGYGRWACALRESGEVIGFAGLKYLPEKSEVDLGYRFLPTYWGRGLATEACKATIAYGFDTLELKQITALVRPENAASIRVLEKCGLTFSGMVQYLGRDVARYFISAHPSLPGSKVSFGTAHRSHD